jgi:lysozyme
MADLWVEKMVQRHEGFRRALYYDTMGNLTGGYGHLFRTGSQLSDEIWREIFKLDMQNAEEVVERLSIPGNVLDQNRRGALIDMAFNLGAGITKFHKMLEALLAGDFGEAASQMLNSLWAKQVGSRAMELASLMRSGVLPNRF